MWFGMASFPADHLLEEILALLCVCELSMRLVALTADDCMCVGVSKCTCVCVCVRVVVGWNQASATI